MLNVPEKMQARLVGACFFRFNSEGFIGEVFILPINVVLVLYVKVIFLIFSYDY